MGFCKKLRGSDLKAFAKKVIEELGLTNDEVMLFLYGGKKLCPSCKELHMYIDRFCPICVFSMPAGEESQKDEVA